MIPTFESDPLFWLAAGCIVFLTGMSKAGLGSGFTVLGVPVLSLWLPPALAAGILLPLLCLIDTSSLWRYWRVWDRRLVALLVPGAAFGIWLGALTAGRVEPDGLRLLVGLIALWFCALHYGGRLLGLRQLPISRKYAFVFAAISGYTSHLAHAGSPPVRAYLLRLNLDKSVYVGTFSVLFLAVNYGKLPPYVWAGQIAWDSLRMSLLLVPCVLAGIATGWWLHARISQRGFTELAYALLGLAGIKLTLDGALGVFG